MPWLTRPHNNRRPWRCQAVTWLCCGWLLLALPLTAQTPADGRASPHLAVIVNDMGNPYFQALAASVRETARTTSGPQVPVQVMSNGYDVDRQRAQMHAAVAAGANILILTAAHPWELENDVRQLRRDGVVVVAVDVATAGAQITVTTHNVEAGFIACAHLGQYLNRDGRIAILGGPPVSSIVERLAGCEAALERTPQIEVVDRQNSGASQIGGMEAMTRVLTRNPDLDAVFSINDPAALGAQKAAQFMNRTDIRIVSVDGAPAVVDALQDEDTLLLSTAAQFPRQIGREAAVRGLEALHSSSVLEETILIPAELIHRGNAHLYCDWQHCDVPETEPDDALYEMTP